MLQDNWLIACPGESAAFISLLFGKQPGQILKLRTTFPRPFDDILLAPTIHTYIPVASIMKQKCMWNYVLRKCSYVGRKWQHVKISEESDGVDSQSLNSRHQTTTGNFFFFYKLVLILSNRNDKLHVSCLHASYKKKTVIFSKFR